MTLDIEAVKIKPMMESVYELVCDWARKEQIEVGLKCPSNIGSADIDSSKVKQVVVNLVRNAISHTGAGGSIEISASRRGEHIEIVVSDNGTGIAKEDQKRVLEPFERTGKEQAERGAGLGLTLVQNIVSLHGGSFDLDSVEGEGTRVTLCLPRVAASHSGAC